MTTPFRQNLFRDKAVLSYLDPDTRSAVPRLVPPSLVRLFGVLSALFAVALVASFFIRVKITARGRGIVRAAEGVVVVRAPTSARVRLVQVEVGQEVRAGQVLARTDVPIVAPADGTVDAVVARADEFVAEGAPIAKIVPSGARLVGFLAIPARYRAHIRSDQPVRIAFDEYPAAEMGFAAGHVRRASDDIVTNDLARAFLGEEPPGGPHFLIEVDVDSTPGGAAVHNGMPFEGVIAVREQRVITLVVAPLRSVLED